MLLAPQTYTTEKLEDHLQSAPARALLKKWTDWRGTEIAPKRSQILIEELGEALPHVVMVEFTSPEKCRFLLAGSGLVNLQGLDFTGLNFYDMAAPDERDLRMRRLHEAENQPCGTYSIQPGTSSEGAYLSTELTAFPIFPDEPGGAMRCLCVSVPLVTVSHQSPVQDSQIIRIAEEFRYIDIGAGVPDETAELFCHPPLSL